MTLQDYLSTLTFDLEFDNREHQILMDDEFYAEEKAVLLAKLPDYIDKEYIRDYTSDQFNQLFESDHFMVELITLVFVTATGVDDGVYYPFVKLVVTSSTEDICYEACSDLDLT